MPRSYTITEIFDRIRVTPFVTRNILLCQKPNGGWFKNKDYAIIHTQDGNILSTIDNGATVYEIMYLLQAYKETGQPVCKSAFLKGIDFLLQIQYANGGWPQTIPASKNTLYHNQITLNDDAMTNVLHLFLYLVKEPLVQHLRNRISWAIEKGIECLLETHIKIDGRYTGWCQQHSADNLAPCWGRSFEPPALAPEETASIINLLQQLPETQLLREHIQSAKAWLTKSCITGVEYVRLDDDAYLQDKEGSRVWARFYDIKTSKPLFCNRDSNITYDYDEVDIERRKGYRWYTAEPNKIVPYYPHLQDLINNNTAVHCSTKEEGDRILRKLYEMGSNVKPEEHDYAIHGERTCFKLTDFPAIFHSSDGYYDQETLLDIVDSYLIQ